MVEIERGGIISVPLAKQLEVEQREGEADARPGQ
jgi:hypothetical protein